MRPMDVVDAILGPVNAGPVGVTVIVPHLNQPDYLRRCLDSLHAQRDVAVTFEIIVVDNGSKALPKDICGMWPNVRLLQEKTPGPGPARNLGIKAAKGALIACIDADCRAEPYWLAHILTAFEDPAVTIIGGDVQVPYEDPNNPTPLEAYERIYAYRNRQYVASGYSGTGNLAMRKATFEKVGDFGGIELAEDRDWGLRAKTLGEVTRYVPQMIVYHPARKELVQMQAKWDRHIAHDFSKVKSAKDKVRWLARATAIGISPVPEIARILRSDRLGDPKERVLAFRCLSRVRLYRFWRMVSVLLRGNGRALSGAWNRE